MQSQSELKFQPKLEQSAPLGRQWLLIGAIAAVSTVVGGISISAQAASLTDWNFDPAANQLEITVKDGTTPRYFLMAQPARIVVDLPDTAIGDVSAQKTYVGVVRQIRVSQFEPGLTRIVMEISPGVSLAPGQVKLQKVGDRATQAGNSRWVLRPLITQSSANTATIAPSSTLPTQPISSIANPPSLSTTALAAPKPFANSPLLQKPVAIEIPSPPPAESSNTATASVAANGSDGNTGLTITAPTSVALAPVLPSSSAQSTTPAQSTATTTPLPPTLVNPIEPNVAIAPGRSVAIAVPSPVVPSTNGVPQAAAIRAADSMPRSTRVESARLRLLVSIVCLRLHQHRSSLLIAAHRLR